MKDRSILWIFLAFILGFMLPVFSCVGVGLLTTSALGRLASQPVSTAVLGDSVAVIPLNGTIMSTLPEYPAQQVITPGRVNDMLEQAAANGAIKAVVVRVNSPGGSVVASDEIYRALLDFEKPVVVWMGDTAASGGYYIACGGDHVMAHPDTLTGSIGVISQFLNAEELLDKIGVDALVITSGPKKDIGSMFREMTEEEKAIWEAIIDQVYEDFVAVVAEARDLPPEQVRELADGRVYTGQQALELGLVDAVGSSDEAIERAAELGGIAGEPGVIELSPTLSFFETLYGFQGRSSMPTMEDVLSWAGAPSLEFRFLGGR